MQLNHRKTPLSWIGDLFPEGKAARDVGRFGASGQGQLNRLRRGFSTKLDVNDASDLIYMMGWILRMQIHNGLTDRGRKHPFIELGHLRWWRWRQQACHSCLVK